MAASSPSSSTGPTSTHWTRKQRALIAAARVVAPALIVGLGDTLRLELPMGQPPESLTLPPTPAIYVFWHRCLLPMAWYCRKQGYGILISQHFDGEWIAQAAARMGYRIFRGSSTRGGHQAMLEMAHAVSDGQSIGFTVDGPRGPRFQAKSGPVYLARATGAPIYALHFSPQRAWELNSWDRMQIPRPFSRLRGVWAGPLRVPASATSDEMEGYRQQMEDLLNGLRRQHDAEMNR